MPRPRLVSLVSLALAFGLVAGCSTFGASPGPSVRPSCPAGDRACQLAAATKLTVGLGFIPSVQFAPFYYADQRGYYLDAGLDVTFQNKIDPDLVTLVGQGSIDVGLADGTSVIPAVSQGIPIRYVATIYGTFPSIVFAKASTGIESAADLKGRKIGIPGRYGSSWIMLQGLLKSAQLTTDDVQVVEYPDFGQGTAVAQGQVDAATGFANNEPVQLELSGTEATVLHVDDVVPLPGPGFIAGSKTLESRRDAIAAFVQATLRAMREISHDPDAGVDAAVEAVPELASQRETQRAILDATIAVWLAPGGVADEYGAIDRDAWAASIEFMKSLQMVPRDVTPEDMLEDLSAPAAG